MSNQPTFWNAAGDIVVDTRREAAASIAPLAGSMARRVADYIAECGSRGATDEEIALALGLRDSTTRARRVELRDAGQVRDSTRRRKTRSGRLSIVWTANDKPLT